MMVIDCDQGSDEWFQARRGIPTASEFNKIITPAKLDPSKSADTYINKLIAEWLRDQSDEGFQSEWMKRGHEIEQEASNYYSFTTDLEVLQVGFCLEDAGRWGCSPDGLIEDGGIEIKCPSPGIHVGYLLANKLPTEYRLQVLGDLLITGHSWWDFISYHPDMEALIVRTCRKDFKEELMILEKALIATNKKLYDKKQNLIKRGFKTC